MLIEAAKGGHTTVVQLLLDYPHSMMLSQQTGSTTMLPTQVGNREPPLLTTGNLPATMPQPINFFQHNPLSGKDLAQLVEAVEYF